MVWLQSVRSQWASAMRMCAAAYSEPLKSVAWSGVGLGLGIGLGLGLGLWLGLG